MPWRWKDTLVGVGCGKARLRVAVAGAACLAEQQQFVGSKKGEVAMSALPDYDLLPQAPPGHCEMVALTATVPTPFTVCGLVGKQPACD